MGLLTLGTPLEWDACTKYADIAKRHAVQQFIMIMTRFKDRNNDDFLFGDEVEYMLIHTDSTHRVARLSLRAPEILARLHAMRQEESLSPCAKAVHWHHENTNWMLEATPGEPYGPLASDLAGIEANMKLRRSCVQALLAPNERLFSITCFPMTGVGDYTRPSSRPNGPIQRSLYISDDVIGTHARHQALARSLVRRRGEKVNIHVNLFLDRNTSLSSCVRHVEPFDSVDSIFESAVIAPVCINTAPSTGRTEDDGGERPKSESVPSTTPSLQHEEIHMDCTSFGTGCCGLQTTFQARNLSDARFLYDQLGILAPIMLALTAATPIFKGLLADTDVRWNVIGQSVDERTRAERGLEVHPSQPPLKRPRWDSIPCYISDHRLFAPEYNDVDPQYNVSSYFSLIAAGIDDALSKHVATMFNRDPLIMYEETLQPSDIDDTYHYENIASANWTSIRLKAPPVDGSMGWRVEFRPMEVQLTDFENAALVVFMSLLTRAILHFNLNFYIPISKVDENMKKAQARSAVTCEGFYFRGDMGKGTCSPNKTCVCCLDNGCSLMTLDEIFNGMDDGFPGLMPLVGRYLDCISCDKQTRRLVDHYLDFISRRASVMMRSGTPDLAAAVAPPRLKL